MLLDPFSLDCVTTVTFHTVLLKNLAVIAIATAKLVCFVTHKHCNELHYWQLLAAVVTTNSVVFGFKMDSPKKLKVSTILTLAILWSHCVATTAFEGLGDIHDEKYFCPALTGVCVFKPFFSS